MRLHNVTNVNPNFACNFHIKIHTFFFSQNFTQLLFFVLSYTFLSEILSIYIPSNPPTHPCPAHLRDFQGWFSCLSIVPSDNIVYTPKYTSSPWNWCVFTQEISRTFESDLYSNSKKNPHRHSLDSVSKSNKLILNTKDTKINSKFDNIKVCYINSIMKRVCVLGKSFFSDFRTNIYG